MAHHRACAACGMLQLPKDRRTRRLQTLFGTVKVEAPRFKLCRCRPSAPVVEVRAASPVCPLPTSRCTPELERVQAELGVRTSFRDAARVLDTPLPALVRSAPGGPVALILDRFDLSRRVHHVEQVMGGLCALEPPPSAPPNQARIDVERLPHLLWNGHYEKACEALDRIVSWAKNASVQNDPALEAGARRMVARGAELRSSVENNEGALIDDRQRHRAEKPIWTSQAESTVNQLVSARMDKRQQTRLRAGAKNDGRACIPQYPTRCRLCLNPGVPTAPASIPAIDAAAALRAALLAEQAARRVAEQRASGAEAIIAHLKLVIAQMRHDRFGASSECGRKLLDQLELQLEEAEAAATEDDTAAGANTAVTDPARPASTRRKPVRAPFPAHLPRERVVIPGPASCPCCQGKLSKLGEDVTGTLEVIPRQFKVIQTVRERFACRVCEAITQVPAPFHVIPRGRAGPELLATILEAKFGQHLPLNRQSETFAHEGIELDVSTLGDWIDACTATLAPMVALIRAHVLAAERIHGDDTTVPVLAPSHSASRTGSLAKSKTSIGRLWTYVRDDRPFGGPSPPAALFHYSADRGDVHPARHLAGYSGILQADAYAGFNDLYHPGRQPGPMTEAACWAYGRRTLFSLAELGKAPIAAEAVRRIDAIFDAERDLNGLPVAQRLAGRQRIVMPLVGGLEAWMRAERGKLSRHSDVARAMDYMLKRWAAFSRFAGDSRICMTNNAAERARRGIAVGRKAWLFAGSDRGGKRAATIYTLIATAKLNGLDPRAWLADVLRRINDHPVSRLHELLPWSWRTTAMTDAHAA